MHRAVAAFAVATVLGCSHPSDRAPCQRDGDCGDEQICYADDRCLPSDLARRQGANVGDECVVVRGIEIGCEGDAVCRMGYCRGAAGPLPAACGGTLENGAPLFGGVVEAVADGTDAVILRWNHAADETLPASIRYLVYVSTTPAAHEFGQPASTVVGTTSARVGGLDANQTYYFVVRAQDDAGQVDCNTQQREATPRALGDCVGYDGDVKPILQSNCVSCHSGATPPRGLHLDSYAGVSAGGLTGTEVVACQPEASLIYLKISTDSPPVGARMPLGGPFLAASQVEVIRRWIADGAPETCPTEAGRCNDGAPPTFTGLTSATLTGEGSARLCWAAASDDVTAAGAIVYDLYQALEPGGQSFSSPPRTTTPAGATCVDVTGLTPAQEYCWVVRARDGAGNRDTNTVERCLTTAAATCIDYATVIQPIFNAECVQCHAGAGAPRNLRLDSHAGVIAGGLTGNEVVACQPASSLLIKKITMTNPPIGVRMPADGPPYLSAAQIAAIEQWVSEGGRSSCSAPDPCSDLQPPTFGGLSTATALDATRVQLCWTAASDDLTPASGLVYDAYLASTPGGQALSAPPRKTSPAGVTCLVVEALSPASQQCWIVRARDAAGNRDANTVERCVTTPAVPAGCVDYATMIQPLLDQNCTRCHAGTRPPQWLRLDSYDHVLAGSVRRNEVIACNAAGSLLVNKISATPSLGRRMPYDGPPYLTSQQQAMVTQWITQGAQRTCDETPACGDTAPPTFSGASSATAIDATTVRVCWPQASDLVTPAPSLRYDVYEAASPGGEAFTQPPQSTVVGALCGDTRVGPGTTTCFVVRARDLAGNRGTNNVEVCATTPANACAVNYDALIQPILSARCTHCHQQGGPRFLDLRTYDAALAGGALRNEVDACDWAGSLINTKTLGASCGRRMPYDGPPWLAPSERSLLQRWIESGARRSCGAGTPCGDTTAPAFAGAVSATADSASSIEVCWSPATDAGTPAESMVYELFDAATPGGQGFNRPAPYAVAGATCASITVPAGEQTCFVVRARDLAGNRDLNTVSRCATPGGMCFAYDAVVQPIFNARCIHCHSGASPPKGIRWDTYAHAVANSEVEACDAAGSKLNRVVEDCEMPYDTTSGQCRACLTGTQTRLLRQWVAEGAELSCPWGGCP